MPQGLLVSKLTSIVFAYETGMVSIVMMRNWTSVLSPAF
jgi:hypothetical protein